MTNYGRLLARDYNLAERAILSDTLPTPNDTVCNIHQNQRTY